MKIPKEFEDVFRGVDLTEGEIRTLTWIAGWESRTVKNLRSAIQKAQDAALSALRPVSRERVEKAWRGCSWCNNEGKKPENWECSLLDDRGFSVVVGDEVVWTNAEFCPVCGKPLTDEAVQMVMERLEELKDGKG